MTVEKYKLHRTSSNTFRILSPQGNVIPLLTGFETAEKAVDVWRYKRPDVKGGSDLRVLDYENIAVPVPKTMGDHLVGESREDDIYLYEHLIDPADPSDMTLTLQRMLCDWASEFDITLAEYLVAIRRMLRKQHSEESLKQRSYPYIVIQRPSKEEWKKLMSEHTMDVSMNMMYPEPARVLFKLTPMEINAMQKAEQNRTKMGATSFDNERFQSRTKNPNPGRVRKEFPEQPKNLLGILLQFLTDGVHPKEQGVQIAVSENPREVVMYVPPTSCPGDIIEIARYFSALNKETVMFNVVSKAMENSEYRILIEFQKIDRPSMIKMSFQWPYWWRRIMEGELNQTEPTPKSTPIMIQAIESFVETGSVGSNAVEIVAKLEAPYSIRMEQEGGCSEEDSEKVWNYLTLSSGLVSNTSDVAKMFDGKLSIEFGGLPTKWKSWMKMINKHKGVILFLEYLDHVLSSDPVSIAVKNQNFVDEVTYAIGYLGDTGPQFEEKLRSYEFKSGKYHIDIVRNPGQEEFARHGVMIYLTKQRSAPPYSREAIALERLFNMMLSGKSIGEWAKQPDRPFVWTEPNKPQFKWFMYSTPLTPRTMEEIRKVCLKFGHQYLVARPFDNMAERAGCTYVKIKTK